MAIPKGLLQSAMQSTRVIKPDETANLATSDSALSKTTNQSKLTFRRDNTSVSDQLNNEQVVSIAAPSTMPGDFFNESSAGNEYRLYEQTAERKLSGKSLKTEQSNKNISIGSPDIVMLTGSEKKIIIYLCEKKEKQDNGKLITKTIHLSMVSQEIVIPITTLKKSIQRLEKKGFLNRVAFKPGREGWTIYSIPSSILKGLL